MMAGTTGWNPVMTGLSLFGEMSGPEALTGFLHKAVGSKCRVQLGTEAELLGTLCTIDGLFNLVLKDAEEFMGGKKTSNFSSVFVRGNNVVHIDTAQ
jgi:U6 snRNA-associated Sm-like protein LSm6